MRLDILPRQVALDSATTAKELLLERVAALSEDEAAEALAVLDRLSRPPLIDYDNVPLEDEEISPDEEAAVQAARDEIARGETIPWEQVKAEFGL